MTPPPFWPFSCPTLKTALAFKEMAGKAGVGLVYFLQNTWHYYRNWEHLLGQKTPAETAGPTGPLTGVILNTRRMRFPSPMP